jgi:hypothetical protein
MKIILAKFNSKCSKCEHGTKKGTEIYYDIKTKKAYCMACGQKIDSGISNNDESYNQYVSQNQSFFDNYQR